MIRHENPLFVFKKVIDGRNISEASEKLEVEVNVFRSITFIAVVFNSLGSE